MSINKSVSLKNQTRISHKAQRTTRSSERARREGANRAKANQKKLNRKIKQQPTNNLFYDNNCIHILRGCYLNLFYFSEREFAIFAYMCLVACAYGCVCVRFISFCFVSLLASCFYYV